jgi:hypothetical protein
MDRDLPFKLDATTFQLGDPFTFTTDLGDLDCLGTPSGTRGYSDLSRDAVDTPIGELVVKVAGLDALIKMKRAAGRPKDLIEIGILSRRCAMRSTASRSKSHFYRPVFC